MANIDQAIPEGAEYTNTSGSVFFKIVNDVLMTWSVKRPEVQWHKHPFQDIPVFLKLLKVVRLTPPQTREKPLRTWHPDFEKDCGVRLTDRSGIAAFSPPPPITPAPAFMVKPALRADGLGVVASDSRKFVWGAKT